MQHGFTLCNILYLAFLQVIKTLLLLPLFSYTHHVPDPSLLLLLILPMQNNTSIKAPLIFIHDVWKNVVLGVGSYSTWLRLVLCLPLYPTPHTVFAYITHNGAFNITITLLLTQLKLNHYSHHNKVFFKNTLTQQIFILWGG